jgi:hypothetical protein
MYQSFPPRSLAYSRYFLNDIFQVERSLEEIQIRMLLYLLRLEQLKKEMAGPKNHMA